MGALLPQGYSQTADDAAWAFQEGMDTKLRTALALAFIVGAALFVTGAASADSNSAATNTASSSVSQTVDIPTDNVLLALALDSSPSIWDVANIHQAVTNSGSVSQSNHIGTNDALLALALGNGGVGFGSRSVLFNSGLGLNDFGTLGAFNTFNNPFLFSNSLGGGDQSQSASQSRVVDQRVSLNQNNVLAALALGRGSLNTFGGGFGTFGTGFDTFGTSPLFDTSGISSIANINRTVRDTNSANSNVNLNSNDVLAALALSR